MELYLPKDSRELVISLSPEEAFFCVQSLGRYNHELSTRRGRLGLQTASARKESRSTTDLRTRVSLLQPPYVLTTKPDDRFILSRALPLTVNVIDKTLAGTPDALMQEVYVTDQDKLLKARKVMADMIAALDMNRIKSNTATYEVLSAELVK